VTVGDDAFIGPAASFTNDLRPRAHRTVPPEELVPTVIGVGATVGANATVICGLRIGRHAFIGAGAVVTTDVGDHALVVGNPARRVGWVCWCGEPLADDLSCGCGRSYEVGPTGLIMRDAG
jgi:acetyltransferase-like isoleucine patch superfamily enzyme